MKTIICPISEKRTDENVARLTGFQVAGWLALYLFTGFYPIILFVMIDYYLRTLPTTQYSPLSWVAYRLLRWKNVPVRQVDKAPKLFAARVGFLYAAFIAILHFFSAGFELFVAVQLIGFALLESVFNWCVGCLVYTYWIRPFYKKRPQ